MDKHIQQTFEIRGLVIGQMVNAAVLQIGVGYGEKPKRVAPAGYTTIGSAIIPLISAPLEFAVPLQAAVRRN